MAARIKRNITPRQKEVLDYITEFTQDRGYAPSLEEIKKKLGVSAVSTIHQHVDTLREKGYLSKEDNSPRSVSPMRSTDSTTEIPLMGVIAAGEPIELIEIPEVIVVPKSMLPQNKDCYALKVSGDSMIDMGVLDGDIVLVQNQNTAENGDIVVAITEKGATLKVLKRQDNKILLEPRNSDLQSIQPKELEIRGKFVGLIRT